MLIPNNASTGSGISLSKLPVCLFVFAAAMVACNIPTFEPDVQNLDIEDAPPQPDFGQPQIDEIPLDIDLPPEEEPLELGPIEVEPEVALLCTTTLVYLRPDPEKPVDPVVAEQAPLLPPGTQLTPTGNQGQGLANGVEYTWYEVETATGSRGWVAYDSGWLAPGDCSEVVALSSGMRIIESYSTLGGNLWGPSTNHYGVDVHSSMGNNNLYAPLDGSVAASDSCPACLEVDPVDGNNPDDFADEYNNGYGAMVITEYPYDEMSQDQIDDLAAEGITVEPGQSVYIMTGHLNPNSDIAATGTDLAAGDSVATIGNSGNSSGEHAHIEVAVTESGLRPTADQQINDYWIGTVVDVSTYTEQGNRVDPSGLFD